MSTQQSIVGLISDPKPNGIIEVRFQCLLFGDDGMVVENHNHRTAFAPNADPAAAVNAQMARVNTHLVQLGYAQVDDAEIERIRPRAAAAWTPEVVAAFQAAQEAAT